MKSVNLAAWNAAPMGELRFATREDERQLATFDHLL